MCQEYSPQCRKACRKANASDCAVKIENRIEVQQNITNLRGGDGGDGGTGGSSGGVGGNATATQTATGAVGNDSVVNCGGSTTPVVTNA